MPAPLGVRNLDHKSFVFNILREAYLLFCFISLGLCESGVCCSKEELGKARMRVRMVQCCGGAAMFSAPAHAQLPIPICSSPCKSIPKHRGARIANSHRISSQSLAGTRQPQTRGSWQCLRCIIFSRGKKLTYEPTYRAWVCCRHFTWILN